MSRTIRLHLPTDYHVGDVDFGVAEDGAYGADHARLVLVQHDDHRAFGDHVHGEAVDAQDARQAIRIDRAEDAVRFARAADHAHADDVAHQPGGRLGLVDLHQLDVALAGDVLDVDH